MKNNIAIFLNLLFISASLVIIHCNYEDFPDTQSQEMLGISAVELYDYNTIKISFSHIPETLSAADVSNYHIINSNYETDYIIENITMDENNPASVFVQGESYVLNAKYTLTVYNITSEYTKPAPSEGISAVFKIEYIADYSNIILNSPINGDAVIDNPVFSWSARTGADSYTIEITDDFADNEPDFSEPVLSRQVNDIIYSLNTEDLLNELENLDAITYYWRVKAHYIDRSGDFSDAEDFNIISDRLYVNNQFEGKSAGNKTSPFKLIQDAVDYANEIDIGEIYVAAGSYYEDILITRNIALYGSFNPDTWLQDKDSYPSIIYGDDARYVISFKGNIDNNTIFDGFVIDGYSSTYQAGIFCSENTSPVIINNTIKLFPSSANNYGIKCLSSNPLITENTFDSYDSFNNHYAIMLSECDNITISNNSINLTGTTAVKSGIAAYSSSVVITGNIIDAGPSSVSSIGIVCDASEGSICNNKIFGGTGIDTYGVSCVGTSLTLKIYNNTIHAGKGSTASYAVYLTNGMLKAYNNTINAGSSSADNYGLYLFSNPDLTSAAFDNNILFISGSSGYAIYECSGSDDPVSVKNNFISGFANLYRDNDESTTMQGINSIGNFTQNSDGSGIILSSPVASGNITGTPGFDNINGSDGDIDTISDNSWQLTATSPCELVQGGRDGNLLGWGFYYDHEDTVRTGFTTCSPANPGAAGWSIGAYEYDTF